MARKTLTERRTEKLAQLDSIRKELAQLEGKAAEHLGRIAVKAGLADLELEDEQLAKEFAAIADKFRPASTKQTRTAARTGSAD